MSKAMEQIVDAYVRLGNRSALEDLRLHHQKLVVDLKGKTAFDFSLLPIGQLEEELAVIEKGLERLHAEGAGTQRVKTVPQQPLHQTRTSGLPRLTGGHLKN